jgi:hypothetical protein
LKIKNRRRAIVTVWSSRDDSVSAFTDDNLFQVADIVRSFARLTSLSQLLRALLFPYHPSFFAFVAITLLTLSIEVRGVISFYFRTPLLLARALAA